MKDLYWKWWPLSETLKGISGMSLRAGEGGGGGGGGEFPQTTISKNPSYFQTKQKEFTTKRISYFLSNTLPINCTYLHAVATAK